jgi:hypothetical protein
VPHFSSSNGFLIAWNASCLMELPGKTAERPSTMKIYFLLMIISGFVALSYMPVRTQVVQRMSKRAASPDSLVA